MEISLQRSHRTREVTGPTPNSVAIRGKPTQRRPREHLILERRKQEELREEATAIVNYNKQFDLKTTWERTTDKRIQCNAVKRRVQDLLTQQRYSLEERRDKLRNLLQTEEESYMRDLTLKCETPIERQARMRERAKTLRDKREKERLDYVEEKLEQRWRDQCEELRSTMTKRHQDQVCVERAHQLKEKAEQIRRQQEEESIYAALWEQDRLAKCKREEMEAVMQTERNKETLKVLTIQTAALEKQHEEMKKLKEQEATLRLEEAALRALEDQRLLEEKRRQQELTKAELDFSLKLKMKRKIKQAQEELAMDMKLIEEMLQQSSDQAQEARDKKNQLKIEMKRYRDYLAEQKKEEEKREKELDAMVSAEVAKQWNKRLEQWRQERAARKKLMEEVMQSRREQIQQKLARIEEEKMAAQKESDEIQASITRHNELDKEQREAVKKANHLLQQHQLQQIQFKNQLREADKKQQRREQEMFEESEWLHRDRVKAALLNPNLSRAHPRRLLPLTPQGL